MTRFKGPCRVVICALLLGLASSHISLKAQNIIVTGDYWTYWDWGNQPDPFWADPNYDDFDWSFGPTPMGFGEPYIVTQLQSGIMTAYFRHYFYLDPPPSSPVIGRVRRDDGVILYLNGIEIFRNNMPSGGVDESTPALEAVEADNYVEFEVDVFNLIPGYNVLAAEVHQAAPLSSDLVFDFQMSVTNGPPGKSVFITSPPDNTTIGPGSSIAITAAAGPANEVIAVDFYEGSTFLARDPQAPYETVVRPGTQSNYVFTAVALYNDSTTRTSAPVRVAVSAALAVVRGPYLQLGTTNSVIVKWRTDFASDSVVRYGVNAGNLDRVATVATVTTEHEVPLTSLSPDTKYFYSIGHSAGVQRAGPDQFFVTAPAQPKPTRVWVIGDSGTGTQGQRDVWTSYNNFTGSRYTDLWLMLGDNAYGGGSDFEYQRGMFDMYPELLRQTVVWPTIGNHDASPAYFDIFTLPRNGEAGGVPSGVENYYSFDYASIHFICLGGYYSGSRLSNGVMCTWLKADLEANTKKWLVAFWHQPPYTKGSHNSDTEGDLIEMRQHAVPILESYGVDLVLCGHSHVYERTYLLRGHYGHSSTLQPSMILNSGSGRIDDSGPYIKQTSGVNAEQGTVYVTAGSSGWVTGSYGLNHPAHYVAEMNMGSLVVDVDGDTMNGTFIRENGQIDDYFTIVKSEATIRIVDIDIEEGTASLSWTSTPGRRYRLEYTTSLAQAWIPIPGEILANGSLTSTGHVTGGAPQTFYRVVQID